MNIDDNGFINLSNGLAECKISLWGANIVSYRPKNEEHDIFWLGELNRFDNVQAIRGGVPICWPRFAEEKLNDRLPRHGFARISGWNLKNVSVDENKIEARLSLLPPMRNTTSTQLLIFSSKSPTSSNIVWKRQTTATNPLNSAKPCTPILTSAPLTTSK